VSSGGLSYKNTKERSLVSRPQMTYFPGKEKKTSNKSGRSGKGLEEKTIVVAIV